MVSTLAGFTNSIYTYFSRSAPSPDQTPQGCTPSQPEDTQTAASNPSQPEVTQASTSVTPQPVATQAVIAGPSQPEDAKINEKATEVLQGDTSAGDEVTIHMFDKSVVDQTSGTAVKGISITIDPGSPTPSASSVASSAPDAPPSVTASSVDVPSKITCTANLLSTCCSCMQVVCDRFFGMGQFLLLGAGSVVGVALNITSIKKSSDVLTYTEKAADDLYHGGVHSLIGDILGIGVLNDLYDAGAYAIGTIVINGFGVVAGIAGTAVYCASICYDAAGGDHFYEMIENQNAWVLIPLAAQTALNSASTATSWNVSSYLGDIILTDDLTGHYLTKNVSRDVITAGDNSLLALAANAAALGLTAGLPFVIYTLSKCATSDNVKGIFRSIITCCD